MAHVLVLYQLKVPELHRLVRTSCHKPPLQEMTFILEFCEGGWSVGQLKAAGGQSHLVRGEAQRPHGAAVRVHRLQKAS